MTEQNGKERNVPGEAQAGRLTPGIRTWFLQQLTEEEMAAALDDLKQLRETGGVELCEFIQELEQVVNSSEPTER
jgi:hypothetical protein